MLKMTKRGFRAFLVLVLVLASAWNVTSVWASSASNPLAALQPGAGAAVANQAAAAPSVPAAVAPKPFVMAILSDLHVRDENWQTAVKLVEAVNDMKGIEAVALLGDLVEKVGSDAELQLAARLVNMLKPEVWAIPGNHDYLYDDKIGKDGKKSRGSRAEQKAKLARFKEAFGQKHLRFAKKQGGHLLIFLPTDAIQPKPIASLSDETIEFLEKQLEENPDLPTVVFAHAPLEGSYVDKDDEEGLPEVHSTAQPATRIKAILKKHEQVFLWVAGHRHTRPGSRNYMHESNKVGRVTCVHVPNIMPEKGWVLTLALSPEQALVRTWDLQKKKFIEKYNRRFVHPKKADQEAGSNSSSSDNSTGMTGSGNQTSDSGTTNTGTQSGTSGVSKPFDAQDLMNWFEKGMKKFTSFINRFFDTLKKFFS